MIREKAVETMLLNLEQGLDGVDREAPPYRRVAAVVEQMVPKTAHRALVWAVILGGIEREWAIAQKVADALGPEAGIYGAHLGMGMLGVIKSSLKSDLPRHEMARRLGDMTRAVEYFGRSVRGLDEA